MNGVIWNKKQEKFVPISSVPVYAMMQQQRLKQSRDLETHNFQLQNVTLTSFTEKNFFEFYDNDTKVTGFFGDIWTLLSQTLNFTLQPVKSQVNTLGIITENRSGNHSGLMAIISQNKTDAIPKLEAFPMRLEVLDFTIPLWTSRYLNVSDFMKTPMCHIYNYSSSNYKNIHLKESHRVFIRHDGIYDKLWMTKIFSWKIWCIAFAMYILFSTCSFWSQILFTRIRYKYQCTVFSEHFFYNFGMLCNQSYIPNILNGRSKILEVSLGLFSAILSMAYGAVLFIYMTKRIFVPPFDDVESLVFNTKYNLVILNGSIADIAFKVLSIDYYALPRETGRLVSASTIEEMRKLACLQPKKYAIYQAVKDFYVHEQIICDLHPTGKFTMNLWITSGIAKNFKYKKSINIGILRLMESGLLNIFKKHWLTTVTENHITTTIEAIKMDQVLFLIAVMCCGIIAASVVFIIEKIVYAYKLNLS